VIVTAVAILICGAWQLARSREARPPLPNQSDVRSIEASFFDRDTESRVTFQVPPAHWDAIFAALLPARKDNDPAKWVGLGELEFKLANGDSYHVELYSISDGPGAFAAGPTFEQRAYYRGGDSSDLEQALGAVFKASDEFSKKPE
jgi:hypothetical protein